MKKLKTFIYREKSHGEYPDIEFEIQAENIEEALKKLQNKGDYSAEYLHEVK